MKNRLSMPVKLFLAIEFVLYLLFMGMDIFYHNPDFSLNNIFYKISTISFLTSSYLKYYGILLCFAFSLLLFITHREKSHALLAAAMLFTVISDFFLLLHPDIMIPGLFTFIIAQSIYLYVIIGGNIKKLVKIISIRIGIAVLAAFLLQYADLIDLRYSRKDEIILFLGLLYAISFLGNVIRHINNVILNKKASKTAGEFIGAKCLFRFPVLFMIGLILFVLCDINVLIYNLHSFIEIYSPVYSALYSVSSVLMWAFYLPSQVIIVLSA